MKNKILSPTEARTIWTLGQSSWKIMSGQMPRIAPTLCCARNSQSPTLWNARQGPWQLVKIPVPFLRPQCMDVSAWWPQGAVFIVCFYCFFMANFFWPRSYSLSVLGERRRLQYCSLSLPWCTPRQTVKPYQAGHMVDWTFFLDCDKGLSRHVLSLITSL